MKYPAIVALALVTLVSSSAPALAESAQQDRMKECNAQAKGKTGDEHKTFMKSCLSGKKAASPAAAAAPAMAAPAPAAAPVAARDTAEEGREKALHMSKSGKPLTAQQQKMKDCNAEAKGMKGDEHKKFMSDCLKKK